LSREEEAAVDTEAEVVRVAIGIHFCQYLQAVFLFLLVTAARLGLMHTLLEVMEEIVFFLPLHQLEEVVVDIMLLIQEDLEALAAEEVLERDLLEARVELERLVKETTVEHP